MLKELLKKRARLWEQAKSIMDKADNEKRSMDGEEQRQVNEIFADMDKLKGEIDTRQMADEISRQMSQITPPQAGQEPLGDQRSNVQAEETRKAFMSYVRRGDAKLTQDEVRALTLAPDTAGGYLAPTEFERQLVQGLNVANVMRGLCTVVTTSNDRQIPVVTSHGSASWVGENGAYSESDESFGQAVLSAYKLGTLVKVSQELLQDSAFDIEAYLAAEFGRRFGVAEETAFTTGVGPGQPTGIVGSAGVGKTTTSALAYTADEIIDFFYSLGRQYRVNATFMMADATIKGVRQLKNGTTGDYMWVPGLTAGEPDRLLGRPVVANDNVATLAASAKIMVFGDFRHYWIADRTGRYIQRLNELYAANGQVGFIGYQREDGKLVLPEAVKTLQMHAAT